MTGEPGQEAPHGLRCKGDLGDKDDRLLASLDHLSGGRFLFGIGGGWNREEMENHGTGYPSRWRRLKEQVEAMKAIWTHDEATYHGDFVNFDAIWCWPKPVTKPHPPVIVGGDGKGTLDRVVSYGDEWMPIATRAGELPEKMARLQDLAAKAGRGPIPVGLFGGSPKPENLEQYREMGVSRVVFTLQPEATDKVEARLDQLAGAMAGFQ